MYVATRQGMFGGRDFAYLTVVAPGEPVTPISRPERRYRAADRRLAAAVAAALVSLLFVLLLGARSSSGPQDRRPFWAAGFACFAVATV